MKASYKKMQKLISNTQRRKLIIVISCCLGASMFLLPAKAIEASVQKSVPTQKSAQNKAVQNKVVQNQNTIKLQGNVYISGNTNPISISLRDTDVKQVLRMISDKAGYNIVFDKSVDGTVTLDLVNVSLNKAFEYVLTVNNLKYWIDGDTLLIASSDSAGALGINKKQIKTIPIKYLDAGKVAKFLNTNIFGLKKPDISSNQIVVTNPRTNEILIFGTENDVALAEKVIKQIDIKQEIKSFDVNYTTTGSMAGQICNSVFPIPGSASSIAASTSGGVTATTTSASSSSGSGSGTTTSDNLGQGGYIACKGSNLITGDSLESLDDYSYSVIYYPDLGRITLIGATKEQIALTEEFIKNTDIKQPQVYMEFSIVELNENGSKELNSTWTISKAPNVIDTVGSNALNAGNGSLTLDKPVHWLTVADSGYDAKVFQTIQMIISKDKGKILANPRIIATNNKSSTINITSEYISSTTTTIQTTPSGNITSKNVVKSPAGITITATPTISPNGYISLNLSPTFSVPGTPVVAANGDTTTPLSSRTLTLTNIRVKDCETLILGGLIQESETKAINKIPFLGEIPVLGAFFRNSLGNKSKNELIIMVTPKIMHDNDDAGSI